MNIFALFSGGPLYALISQILLAIGVEWDTALTYNVNKSHSNDRNARTLPLYSAILFFVVSVTILIFLLVSKTFPQIEFCHDCQLGDVTFTSFESFLQNTWDLTVAAVVGFFHSQAFRFLLCILSGGLYEWGLLFYFPMLFEQKPDRVIVFLQGIPVIIMVASSLISWSFPSRASVIGLAIVLGGLLFYTLTAETRQQEVDRLNKEKESQTNAKSDEEIHHEKLVKKQALKKLIRPVIYMNVLFGLSALLYNYSYPQETFVASIVFEGIGWAIGGLFIYARAEGVREDFHATISSWLVRENRPTTKVVVSMIIVSETIFFIAKVLSFLAIMMGPLFAVSLIMNCFILVAVFILNIVAEKVWPPIFKVKPMEELTRKSKLNFIVTAVAVFVGLMISSI
jgi:hypothetical protein